MRKPHIHLWAWKCYIKAQCDKLIKMIDFQLQFFGIIDKPRKTIPTSTNSLSTLYYYQWSSVWGFRKASEWKQQTVRQKYIGCLLRALITAWESVLPWKRTAPHWHFVAVSLILMISRNICDLYATSHHYYYYFHHWNPLLISFLLSPSALWYYVWAEAIIYDQRLPNASSMF